MTEACERMRSGRRGRGGDRWSEAIEHLRKRDARWGSTLDRIGPCLLRPIAAGRRFEVLVRSIVSQQISTRAADSIEARLRALQGGIHDPTVLLGLSLDALRAAGVSAGKGRSLRELAEHVSSGSIPLGRIGRMDDQEIIDRLTQVRGIGRWTAEMFLVFALNRPDVLSTGDLGIRDGIRNHFQLAEMPAPRECEELAEPWRPYRSVAMWYLWRSRDARSGRQPGRSG